MSLGRLAGALVAVLLAGCSDGGPAYRSSQERLDEALQAQPAGLVADIDALLIDTPDPGCGGVLQSSVLAVDAVTWETLWEVDVPWTRDAPVIDGDRVLVTSPWPTAYPPSVSAINLQTGAAVWQRFIADTFLRPITAPDGRLEVRGDAEDLVIDADGAVEPAPSGVAAADRPAAVDEARRVGRGLVIEGPSLSTAISLDIDHVPDHFSTAEVADIDDQRIAVVLSSGLGPNGWLIVVDRASGSIAWELESMRSVRLAGPLIVYDVRSAGMTGEGPTREVIAVGADDPADVRWSRPAYAEGVPHNSNPGGFIGVTERGPVMALRVDESLIRFVVVETGDELPETLTAAPLTGFERPQVVVDDDVIAAATMHGLAIGRGEGDGVFIDTTRPVLFVGRAGDVVIAVVGTPEVGCY